MKYCIKKKKKNKKRQFAQKADCGRNIPCRTVVSHLCQQCMGPDAQPADLQPHPVGVQIPQLGVLQPWWPNFNNTAYIIMLLCEKIAALSKYHQATPNKHIKSKWGVYAVIHTYRLILDNCKHGDGDSVFVFVCVFFMCNSKLLFPIMG